MKIERFVKFPVFDQESDPGGEKDQSGGVIVEKIEENDLLTTENNGDGGVGVGGLVGSE